MRGIATFKDCLWEPDTKYKILYNFDYVQEKQLEAYDENANDIISLCIPILDRHNRVEILRQPKMRYGDYMDLKIEAMRKSLAKCLEEMAETEEL